MLRVNAPEESPSLEMTVFPVVESPGAMLVAVRMAMPSLEFLIFSEPEANVLVGLADELVKTAVDATATPTASTTRASASSSRLRLRRRTSPRDGPFPSGGAGGGACCGGSGGAPGGAVGGVPLVMPDAMA